jgi:hypothetical protein
LILIDYLLKHCHERFVSDVRLRADVIRRLRNYKFFEDGRDIGSEVRHKALAVINLLENKELLQKERRIARETEGKIKGFSHEYSGFYEDVEKDPFGAVENEDRLALEYQRDQSLNREEEHKSEEEAEEVEEQAPKLKKRASAKGKKLKKKRHSKKAAEPEPELEMEDEEDDNNNPPNYATEKDFFDEDVDQNKKSAQKPKKAAAVDDFLSEIGNKPMLFEPDLVTGGYNSAAAAQFGWLTPAVTEPITNNELALFDFMPEKKPAQSAPAPLNRSNTQVEGFAFEFGEKAPAAATPFDEDAKKEPEASVEVDPWQLADKISVLDNLHDTNEDRRIRQSLQDKRERMRNGPKLKDLQKQAREEQLNVNPFDAMVQGAPAGDYNGSMALVPVGNFGYNDPAAYSQALVPMNPYGYGYPPMYPPMMPYGQPDPYAYPRPY